MRPLAAPGLTFIDFLAPQGAFKNRPIFGTLKIDQGGRQSRPLAALGPPRAPFGRLLGSILSPIFDQMLILFLNPQNQDFAIPYHTFEVFSNPKALILGPIFNNIFDPIFGSPLEEPFGSPWSPKVPTWPPHVEFGPFLGSPLDPKIRLWSSKKVVRNRSRKKVAPRTPRPQDALAEPGPRRSTPLKVR